MDAYLYPMALAVISLLTLGLEALFPWRRDQPLVRRRTFLSDLVHLVFNGHFLGVLLFGIATHRVLPHLDRLWAHLGWTELVYRNAAAAWPLWVQIPVALLLVDFVQWGIHVLLHRVPWLWELHKCHHSVVDGEMSWIVAFRFQWAEVVVYRALQYLPLAFFGFSPAAVMTHAIFGTLIGHLNHSNLKLDWGPLRYVLNSPRMHLWHHDYEGDSKSTVNFGIIFSLWDWIFGTAKLPDRPPAKIGFAGVETYPKDFLSHAAWPLSKWRPARPLAPLAGAAILGLGVWLHLPPAREAAAANPAPLFGEEAAQTQPASSADALAYASTVEEADAALAHFGRDARDAGFARPEWMVSVGELAAALGAARLAVLDARSRDAFEKGHVPTAQPVGRPDYSAAGPIPGLSLDAAALSAMLRERGVGRDDAVVIYGDGPEAYRLWWTLRTVGGLEARVLDGGIARWKARGGAVARGAGLEVQPGDVELEPREADLWWADLRREGARLLDTRTRAEFTGERRHPRAARAGRVPGAELLPYEAVLRSEADPRLRPPSALRALVDELSLGRDERVITYCQSGTRSSVVYFALLQAGLEESRVTNYDGSWAEYSRLDAPVETGAGRCRAC